LAVAAAEYGDLLLSNLKLPAEARAVYEVALTQTKLLATSPELTLLQQGGVALNHYRLATAALKQGGPATAAKHYARWLGLREARVGELEDPALGQPTPAALVGARINRMLAQARCGKHAEAAAAADELVKRAAGLKPGDPNLPRKAGWLLQAACAYGL